METTEIISTEKIQQYIDVVRGKQVILDSDLALLYHVETGNLNKAMKRNQKRFPEDFCFQISKEEYEDLKFQNGISSFTEHGGRRSLPYVYTEQGIAMLSAVLKSDVAIQISIQIMKTFVELRRYLSHGSVLLEKVNNLEIRHLEFEQYTEKKLSEVFDYIATHTENNQKIFYDGQIFDAYSLLTHLIEQADSCITLIDGYVDISTLNILSKKKSSVKIKIYTYPNTRLTISDIQHFNAQYPLLEIKYTTSFHDRFLIIDNSYGYHIGASLKDAGKKCFGINKIEDLLVIHDLLQRVDKTSIKEPGH